MNTVSHMGGSTVPFWGRMNFKNSIYTQKGTRNFVANLGFFIVGVGGGRGCWGQRKKTLLKVLIRYYLFRVPANFFQNFLKICLKFPQNVRKTLPTISPSSAIILTEYL